MNPNKIKKPASTPHMLSSSLAGSKPGLAWSLRAWLKAIRGNLAKQKFITPPPLQLTTLTNSQKILYSLLILGICSTLYNLYFTHQHLYRWGQTDLRNKVVAARNVQLDHNPYANNWQPGDSTTLLDPLTPPKSNNSRFSSSPTNLLFFIPLAHLPFIIQIKIWYLAQWLFFFLTLLFTLKSFPLTGQLNTTTIFLLFSGSPTWFSHLTLGQIYIIYPFLLSLTLYLYSRHKLISSLPLGFLITLRPTYLLILIPFLLIKQFKFILTTLTLTLLIAFSTQLAFPTNSWTNFSKYVFLVGNYHPTSNARLFNPQQTYPLSVEGINFLTQSDKIDPNGLSIKTLSRRFLHLKLSSPTLIILWSVWTTTLTLFLKKHLSLKKTTHLFLAGSLLILTTDFFIPSNYFIYSLIQWLVPSTLISNKTTPHPNFTTQS